MVEGCSILRQDRVTSHAAGRGQGQFQGNLANGSMATIFTWLESNWLWDLLHLRVEGLHCFSSRFNCSKAKTDQMLGRYNAETVCHVWSGCSSFLPGYQDEKGTFVVIFRLLKPNKVSFIWYKWFALSCI